MSKEKIEGLRPQDKQPATIKVTTLVKALAIVVAVAGAFIAGTMIERVDSQKNTQNIVNAASSIFEKQSKS